MNEHLDPSDFFATISKDNYIENKIKGSKFLGFAFPVNSRLIAEETLERHRKQHYDATHNCFAYSVGCENEIFRYSDDGEPNGTAGKPIFQAIKHIDYKNILVIVTRYFGGTKLGVGPLARAYYDTALNVLSSSEKKIEYLTRTIQVVVDYNFVSTIKRLLDPIAVQVQETYLEQVSFTAKILQSKFNKLWKDIIENTQGKVDLKEKTETV